MQEKDASSGPVGFSVRQPRGIEYRICRMLLADLSHAAGEVGFTVAIDNGAQRVVGAAGVREDLSVFPRWILDVHVIPPFRRRGIGKSLIESIAVAAFQSGVGALDTWVLPVEATPQVAQLQQFGFESYRKIYEYEAPAQRILDTAEVLYKRVVGRGSIPASAKLLSLRDADMARVIYFHTTYLGGTSQGLLPRMGGGNLIPFDPYLSLVLLVDDRIMGLALGHFRGESRVFEFDSLVIHPSLRGGWASAWLRYEQARRGLGLGCTAARYLTLDQQLGARHSGKRVPNRLVQTTCWMRRVITPEAIPPEHVEAADAPC